MLHKLSSQSSMGGFAAIALQRAFAEREGEPLNVRVGLNAGEPIEEDGDLFGATVILASRIRPPASTCLFWNLRVPDLWVLLCLADERRRASYRINASRAHRLGLDIPEWAVPGFDTDVAA